MIRVIRSQIIINTLVINRGSEMSIKIIIPPDYLFILNQIFDIEQKASKLKEINTIQKNIDRVKEYFGNNPGKGEYDFYYYNPLGEKYDETRTDCEASIAGSSTENLIITEVIKPIIRVKKDNFTVIAQKAVVIVESNKLKENENGRDD